MAFYNPASKGRDWQLRKAMSILARYRPPGTPVVLARDITRASECVQVEPIGSVDLETVDMRTLVLVGNSETRWAGRWIYTPRGYRQAEDK